MTKEDIEKVKRSVIRKYPISAGLALSGIDIELSESVSTAAVVGKKNDKGIIEVQKIKVNPEFFERLTFGERVFVLAHEACHISLKHFSRSIDKPEKDIKRKYDEYCMLESDAEKRKIMMAKLHKKYHNIWNIATDACINAFLRRDGLSFPDNVIDPKTGRKMQFIDMKEGFFLSAEKIYDSLVLEEEKKEKEQKEKEKNNPKNDESNDNDKSDDFPFDDVDIDNYEGVDSHEEWTDDEEVENQDDYSDDEEIDETEVFNREIQSRSESKSPNLHDALSKVRGGVNLDKIIPVAPVVSWKRLLVGTLEATDEVWGKRRANKYSPNARIEERTYETLPEVEVILDTSGSISDTLLKGFLKQLVTLFESLNNQETIIKVGCFGTSFSGFTTIKNKKDIANYKITGGGGTNFEVAATSFTPDPGRRVTKIVFTDGCLGTPQKTRVENVIWIVFGNQCNFTPIGGRIIRVSEEDYKKIEESGYSLLNEDYDTNVRVR